MSSKSAKGIKYETGVATEVTDLLTVEAPLQVTINGNPFTVTMRTPGDDYRLVTGLLFTEGVVKQCKDQFPYSEEKDPDSGVTVGVDLQIPEVFLCENLQAKRSLLINASCGVCGTRELADLNLTGEPLEPRGVLDVGILPGLGVAVPAQALLMRCWNTNQGAVLRRRLEHGRVGADHAVAGGAARRVAVALGREPPLAVALAPRHVKQILVERVARLAFLTSFEHAQAD